jgi:hypothetical protein
MGIHLTKSQNFVHVLTDLFETVFQLYINGIRYVANKMLKFLHYNGNKVTAIIIVHFFFETDKLNKRVIMALKLT